MSTKMVLGKDERIISENKFTSNLILFWLKARYTLTNKRVTGHTPNTLLGIIPLGKSQVAQPLKTIASVASSTKFRFLTFLFGLILIVVGLCMWGNTDTFFAGFILAILGLVNLLNCITATFVITNNAGQSTGYKLSILEKSKVQSFVNEINTVIADL
ncbi:MAG: hypothetical protein HQ534_10175 [Armatimonadetes bacterium]|nr:hypothetical protein [Armatimonadota bacterium]